jgi:hemoglobin
MNTPMSGQNDGQTPSLYEWAGGEKAIRSLFHEFYTVVVSGDPILSQVFQHMGKEHMNVVADFVCEVLGGPTLYTNVSGRSHSSMIAKHIGKMLNERQRQTWMNKLLETADRLKLPDDPEFRSALVSYLEWGSRIAKINSHGNTNPVEAGAPMPKWGWGETGGPYRG